MHINCLVGKGDDVVLVDVKDGLDSYMESWRRGNKLNGSKEPASMRGSDIIR